MAKENIYLKKEKNMKENSVMDFMKVRVYIYSLMVQNMNVILKIIKLKEKENGLGLMVINIKVS